MKLSKGEIVGIIGSAIFSALAGAVMDIATLYANKKEIQESVKRELKEANEVKPQ